MSFIFWFKNILLSGLARLAIAILIIVVGIVIIRILKHFER